MKRALLLVAIALAPSGIVGQEMSQMTPLPELLADTEDEAVMAYGFRRCAALWTNYELLWLQDAPELSEVFSEQKKQLVLTAHLFAQDTQEREIPLEVTYQEILDIAQVYRERADRNRALTGDYFAGDPLIEKDGPTCRTLFEMINN